MKRGVFFLGDFGWFVLFLFAAFVIFVVAFLALNKGLLSHRVVPEAVGNDASVIAHNVLAAQAPGGTVADLVSQLGPDATLSAAAIQQTPAYASYHDAVHALFLDPGLYATEPSGKNTLYVRYALVLAQGAVFIPATCFGFEYDQTTQAPIEDGTLDCAALQSGTVDQLTESNAIQGGELISVGRAYVASPAGPVAVIVRRVAEVRP